MNFVGTFFGLLNPYALLIGLLGLAMFATHGAVYIAVKTEGDVRDHARGWALKAWGVYLALFVVACVVTIKAQPQLLKNYSALPLLWVVPVAAFLAIVMVGVSIQKGAEVRAFLASALAIAWLMALVGTGIFPNLVPALNDPSLSLTLMNASSSRLTLKVMFVVALLGMSIVIAYTIWVYFIFRGKVQRNNP